MRSLRIPLFIVIVLSFGFGVGWGIKLHRDKQRAQGLLKAAPQLHVLAYKGILSREMLEAYEIESGFPIALTEVSTPEELWEKIETPPDENRPRYDLVTLMSYQVPIATHLLRIQPLDLRLIKNLNAISADFRSIPGDMNHERLVPLLWGLTGILYRAKEFSNPPQSWAEVLERKPSAGQGRTPRIGLLSSTVDLTRLLKLPDTEMPDLRKPLADLIAKASLSRDFLSAASLFQSPETPSVIQINHGEARFAPANSPDWHFVFPREKASLWILSMALTQEAQNTTEAHRFLDFLLQQKSAVAISRSARQASTNRWVEESELDPQLKPSYLRQVPLTQYMLWGDFSRSREIRALLPETTVVKESLQPVTTQPQ